MVRHVTSRHLTSRHMTLDLFGDTKTGPLVVLRTIMGEFERDFSAKQRGVVGSWNGVSEPKPYRPPSPIGYE